MYTTVEQVESFIKKHPISTGGALNPYNISVETKDDGDVYHVVTLPFWSQNDSVVDGVLDFLRALRREPGFDSHIYLRTSPNVVECQILFSVCNPDQRRVVHEEGGIMHGHICRRQPSPSLS